MSDTIAADELRQFIERIERLESEKADLAADLKEVFAEAKGRGFDTKAMRTILKRRKRDAAELAEEDAIVELYMQALGMLADTPLGKAAVERATGRKKRGGKSLADRLGDRLEVIFPGQVERNVRL